MKRRVYCLALLLLCTSIYLYANGVAITDGVAGEYFKLVSSDVNVTIDNQIAVVTTTQTFENNLGWSYFPKYAFPLPNEASATQLRWEIDDQWYIANIAPVPPDSTPPGPGEDWDENLLEYMGDTPLFFDMTETGVQDEELLTVELTYVMLLPYEFGTVSFSYPNDYTLLQYEPLESQSLHLELQSVRTIDTVQLTSHSPTQLTNDGHLAVVEYEATNEQATTDYHVEYQLSLDELGLFGFSTMLDSVPDEFGNGFFVFVAEPDPSENVVIDKVFTLVVDRSGSMSGNKIVQARNAASFIVNHLNDGDMFNIVDFSTNVYSFREEHVPFNETNQTAALDYIGDFLAGGSTNISGAFSTAIPQFSTASDSTANIIIFFTDGMPTTGITGTEQLVQHVHDLVSQTETNIFLFNFGIGMDVNQQLLSLMAQDNNGIAQFLQDNDLEEMITAFYMLIQNPVLIDPVITFEPDNIVEEQYPSPTPNMYQGTQLIASGRYNTATNMTLTLAGQSYNSWVEYDYDLPLSGSLDPNRQFLTKIWAKQKIEHLLAEYYLWPEGSPEAEAIEEEIIAVSMAYGVISPFTSFHGGNVGVDDEPENGEDVAPCPYELLGNAPNPFNPTTTIRFNVNTNMDRIVKVKIFNVRGQLVDVLALHVTGPGRYEVTWDGRDLHGHMAASGTYFYIIDFGDALLSAKMVLLK